MLSLAGRSWNLPSIEFGSLYGMDTEKLNWRGAHGSEVDAAGRSIYKSSLIDRYGIVAEMIDPSTLSKIVGVNKKTLLGMARRGALPIVPKRLGRSVLFSLDDVVDWLRRGPEETTEPRIQPPAEGEVEVLPLELVASIVEHAAAAGPETPKQRIDRISRQVLAEMNRKKR